MTTALAMPSLDTSPRLATRAVLRRIEAGNSTWCSHCDKQIKFQAKKKLMQVICNIYTCAACKGLSEARAHRRQPPVRCQHNRRPQVWSHNQQFHEACYLLAGEPHGAVNRTIPTSSAGRPIVGRRR